MENPLVITDDNYQLHVKHMKLKLGRVIPDADPGCRLRCTSYGNMPYAKKAEEIIDVIPRDLWKDLIDKGQGSFLHDSNTGTLQPHDQGSTNYCWAHGSVRTLEYLRLFEGQCPHILSAESVAVPLTGGRNRGGYPEEALSWLYERGACRQSFWPNNDRNIDHASEGWETDANNHRILSWIEVKGFDMQMTCALCRIPVAIGLGWWSHLVCQLDPVYLGNGKFGLGCDNSWGADYGENGYFILSEERAEADLGAFAPLSETFFEDPNE